jgi:hypothetical protein
MMALVPQKFSPSVLGDGEGVLSVRLLMVMSPLLPLIPQW